MRDAFVVADNLRWGVGCSGPCHSQRCSAAGSDVFQVVFVGRHNLIANRDVDLARIDRHKQHLAADTDGLKDHVRRNLVEVNIAASDARELDSGFRLSFRGVERNHLSVETRQSTGCFRRFAFDGVRVQKISP